MLGFLTQHAQAQRVKSADGQPSQQLGIYQGANPLVHFTRGFIGKSQCDHLPARVPTLAQQISDFLRNDSRLATTGSSQDQTGPIHIQHGLTLHGVQVGGDSMAWCSDRGGHGGISEY